MLKVYVEFGNEMVLMSHDESYMPNYTWIHLSPWWMLFRSHIDIFRSWWIFFTYLLTLYDGAI